MRLVCITVILSALLFSLAGCKSNNAANTGARTSPAAQKAAMDQQLIEASISGDAARVKALLDQGANPNARDADGRNPLTEAAWRGHTEIIKLLLQKGADPKQKKNDGQDAISIAKARGQQEALSLLAPGETISSPNSSNSSNSSNAAKPQANANAKPSPTANHNRR